MTKKIFRLFPLLALLVSFGCGGGGSSADTPVITSKATISFSMISTATLPFRISGVQIDAVLPTGITVTTGDIYIPRLITDGLVAGSAVGVAGDWQTKVFGSYSAPNRVRLIIADGADVQTGFGPGEIVRLTCSISAGTTISESDLQAALEKAILDYKITFTASGWDKNATTGINPKPLTALLILKATGTISD